MTALQLADTHAHLIDQRFAQDLPEVLSRAEEAGVARMIVVGYDLPTSRAAVELARQNPGRMQACVGIHPNDAGAASSADYDEIARLAEAFDVVGIGETGLDNYRDRTSPEQQRTSLDWHLRLAEELGLPVVIHNREADADIADMLETSAARRGSGTVPGVLHCFSSTDATFLDRMLAAGYFVSFAGPLTFKNAGALPEMAHRVPLDRLVVESDCPYLAPDPWRGRRNEPAFVRFTAERLAAIHGLELERIAAQLWINTCALFPPAAVPNDRVHTVRAEDIPDPA